MYRHDTRAPQRTPLLNLEMVERFDINQSQNSETLRPMSRVAVPEDPATGYRFGRIAGVLIVPATGAIWMFQGNWRSRTPPLARRAQLKGTLNIEGTS